ncbi:MAG: glycerophosphodiester phosphodiesterase [Gemmatimonadota bacterium]
MPRQARENTLASFDLALQAGADAIELDVHVSADGVVVVHHDPRIGGSEGEMIERLTRGVLARYGVPTLDEVCDLVREQATLYVEAKARRSAASIIECLTAHSVRAAVHSFDAAVISTVREFAPTMATGFLVDYLAGDAAAVVLAHGVRDFWPHRKLITARLVDDVHRVGARVIAWTVNDVDDARRLHELGVDGLCSDDVRALRSALQI